MRFGLKILTMRIYHLDAENSMNTNTYSDNVPRTKHNKTRLKIKKSDEQGFKRVGKKTGTT